MIWSALAQQCRQPRPPLTAADYRTAFSPLVAFMALGIIASLLLKESLRPTWRLCQREEHDVEHIPLT